jgi:hypothetical protein
MPRQGAFRREYWLYFQGTQRGSGMFWRLPEGAPAKAAGRVAPLDKGADHCLRDAPYQQPWLAR